MMRTPLTLPSLALSLALLSGCGGGSDTPPESQVTQGSQDSDLTIRRVETTQVDPGQAAADAMAEEFGNSLQAAFDEQERIRKQGGTPEQIIAAHARFESVHAANEMEIAAMWMAPSGLDKMPLGEAIGELIQSSEVTIEAGELADAWDELCPISVDGLSRAQAIDSIADHFEVTATFPNPNPWSETKSVLTFEKGQNKGSIAHSGPFRIATTETEEHAPYGVGKISARAHAIGLPDVLLASNATVSEWFSVDDATNAGGESLLAQANMTRLTQPHQNGQVFCVDTSVDLARLVRSVEAIHSFTGSVQLQLPIEVHELMFSGSGPSKQTVAGIDIHLKQTGTDNQIEAAVGEDSNYEILWAPEFADGSPMGIVHTSSYEFSGTLSTTIQTPEKPGNIRIKLIRSQRLNFPFVLSQIPMEAFEEQPVQLEELSFEAAQPVSVVFSEFVSRTGDFPKVKLRSVNHSNKDIKSIQVKLIYMDANNKTVGDCFTSLTPTSFTDSLPVYIKAGEANTLEQTAFFMPKETDTMQVAVQKVDFMDYSTWEAPQ